MGLTTIKTYENKLLYTLGALSAMDTSKELGYLLKEALLYGTDGLKGGPAAWAVVGSSNGSAAGMDAVDRWTDRTKVVMAAGNHSWVVVQQPALGSAPGYLQVCIDFNSATNGSLSVVFSRAAGFTGGSISARPTATDQVVIVEAAAVFDPSQFTTSSCGINCLKSTDGKVTRLMRSIDGYIVTAYRNYLFMEQLNHVETYWPSDCVVGVCAMSIAGLAANSHIFTQQGSSHAGRMTCEGYSNNQLSYVSAPSGMLRPDYGGAWPVFPCGLLVDTGLNKGKIGDFFDLWSAPSTLPSYEYLAGSGGDFEFVNVGGIVQPWVGTALIVP